MNGPEITCKEMVELMTDYLEGALPPVERERFEEHLAICDGCTNYLNQVRDTVRLAGMLSEDDIPEQQKQALLAAFRTWKDP